MKHVTRGRSSAAFSIHEVQSITDWHEVFIALRRFIARLVHVLLNPVQTLTILLDHPKRMPQALCYKLDGP